ncbi:hypothetical protein F4781DRAFT_411618 [Annulohypoxylon bovei var. microspora]|nr:hypothetical protein F4781DRAFT_411618 [Annulohypoxylon bovei var. microspora]
MPPNSLNLAPGISLETRFDFKSALDSIKSQVHEKIPPHEWHRSLSDAFRTCLKGNNEDQWTSILWFTLQFIDILWNIMFGKMTGPSPWRQTLNKVSRSKPNGNHDKSIDLNYLKTTMDQGIDTIENIIQQTVRSYFPMTIP